MIPWEHGKNASESIEPAPSETNLTDALPHTPELPRASLEDPFELAPIPGG
jgi:hypothetical protein